MTHRTNSTLTANSLKLDADIADIELDSRAPASAVPDWIADDQVSQSPINIDPIVYPTGPVDTLRTTSPYSDTIKTTVSSPDGTFLATLSDDGMVALWPFSKFPQLLKPHFAYQTPFNLEHSKKLKRRVIVTVSNGGRYIALSSCVRLKNYDNLHHALKEKEGVDNFLLIDTEAQQAIRPHSLRHTCGIVSFFKDDELATCDASHIRIYSVHNWKKLRKLNMSVLLKYRGLLKNPDPLQQLLNMFGYNRIFWFEGKDMVSMWDIRSGALQTRFKLPQDYREVSFAVSPNGHLFATCTTPTRESGETSFLTVYLVESGLALQQIPITEEVEDIFFMEEGEKILLYGPNADNTGYFTCIYDSYSLRPLKESAGKLPADRLYLFAENPNLLVLLNTDNTLETYSSITDEVSDKLVEVMKYPDGQIISKDKSMHINTVFETEDNEDSTYSVEFAEALVPKLNICPWQKAQRDLTAEFLDDQGDRILIVTPFLILIFFTKSAEPQYLWSVPKHVNKENNTIQTVYLDFQDPGTIIAHVLLSGPNDVSMRVKLPTPQEKYTKSITQDLCESLALIRDKLNRDMFRNNNLVKACKDVIKKSIPKNPGLFSRSSNTVFPLREFICADWSDIVKDILAKKQYVPCFYREAKDSALTLAIGLHNGPIVKALIDYYSMKAKEDPNYMILICPALPYLRRYPDYVALMMKATSYNPTRASDLIQQLDTKIRPGDFERSSKPDMVTFCLTAQQLYPRDKSIVQNQFDRSYEFGKSLGDTVQKIIDYYTAPERDFNEEDHNESEGNRDDYKPEGDRDHYMDDNALLRTHPANLCNVPLPGLSTYTLKKTSTWKAYFWHKWIAPRSPFSAEAFRGHAEFFAEPVMEAVINFKWQRFARQRFLLYWACQLIFFILFGIAISVDENIDSHSYSKYLLLIVVIMGFIFLMQEFRQLISLGWLYISVYNAIDLAAFILPLSCGLIVWNPYVEDHEPPLPLKSYAIFILWVQFILQLRIIKQMGIFLAIVFEIIKEILSFIVLLALIIIAFAHALFVLLRTYEVTETLPTYKGSILQNNADTVVNQLQFQQIPESDTDLFQSFRGALQAVYFFIDGETNTIEGFHSNTPLIVFKLIFSFLTGIVLLNILIALMAEVYGKTMADGERAWLRQMAGLIAEVEVFLMSPTDRANPDLFPSIIYYEANPDKIADYTEKLKEKAVTQEELRHETEMLARELKTHVQNENEQLIKKLEDIVYHLSSVATKVGETEKKVEHEEKEVEKEDQLVEEGEGEREQAEARLFTL